MDRKEPQELLRVRLSESRALLKAGLFDGAFYLAGYAVECALKACIAKGTHRHEFPDKKRVDSSHTHNLRDLVRIAGLDGRLEDEARRDPGLGSNWDILRGWSEQSRYQRHPAEAARALVEAVGERKHVVIAWIRPHW